MALANRRLLRLLDRRTTPITLPSTIVISYASPFQNSHFEAFAIPVTTTNEGARTGTVLSMTLTVTDLAKNMSKPFLQLRLRPMDKRQISQRGFPAVCAGFDPGP